MGELRPDPGGPPEDGSGGRQHGLPDLPPEWGTVIIPDDAAELDHEAAALRRELRRTHRQTRLRTARGAPGATEPSPSLGIPLVIMAVAVLTTMVSLFVVTWGRPAPVAPPVVAGSAPTVPSTGNGTLADVVLIDAGGLRVRVSTLLPAALLLVDGCDCQQLVLATAAIAPVGVRVVPVARTAPALLGAPAEVRPLADTDGILRARYANGTAIGPSSATALLVDGTGEITSVVAIVRTIDDIRAPLLALGR
jgi:hypothetical protein